MRRVADRHLRLVARRDHEPAVRVRERHEASSRGCAPGGSRRRAPRAPRARRGTRATTASIGISRKSTPRFSLTSRASSRVASDEKRDGIETVWTRSGPSASAAIAAVSAESMPPEIETTTCSEAVLLDVVAEAEPQREAQLLELRGERRHGGLDGLRALARRGQLERRRNGRAGARPLELAAAHVAQPPADRLGGVEVDDEQRLLEAGRACDDLALVVEDDRVTVEDELVLPADEVAERDVRGVVPGPRDEHLLAVLRLAAVVRRRREVDEERRAGEREIGRRGAGLPDVLADRRADQDVAELEQQELAAGGEVAVLVEDAVVREELLAVDALHGAARAHERGVREVAVERRPADERHDPLAAPRHLVHGLAGRSDEPGPQEEVLGRVSGHRQLREDDEIGGGALRLLDRRGDSPDVAVEVADDDVQLRERDPHRRILACHAGRAEGRGFRLTVTNVTVPRWERSR